MAKGESRAKREEGKPLAKAKRQARLAKDCPIHGWSPRPLPCPGSSCLPDRVPSVKKKKAKKAKKEKEDSIYSRMEFPLRWRTHAGRKALTC